MNKTIEVCDFCEKETPIQDVDGYRLCGTCSSAWVKALTAATEHIQTGVNFSIRHRMNLLWMVKNNADPKYWGSDGLKMREDIIKAYEVE